MALTARLVRRSAVEPAQRLTEAPAAEALADSMEVVRGVPTMRAEVVEEVVPGTSVGVVRRPPATLAEMGAEAEVAQTTCVDSIQRRFRGVAELPRIRAIRITGVVQGSEGLGPMGRERQQPVIQVD